ncbi:Transcription factor, fungi [Penicillium expansum]|nr:Transcription factor, fungi [Penicillium expansum]
MKDFVMFWLSTGANLALAEPFIEQCAKDIDILFASFYDEENGYTVYAQRLLQNSRLRLNIDESSNISNFSAQFLGQNFRWETLGFFFCAVCRATIDLPFFPLLYANDSNRIALRRLSTKLIDIALSNVLSLDGLNDLQLILQFESFIVHSHVDGVHKIRKAAYATVYSADKNVAIFLGRPPRMSKRFTHFQLPLNQTSPGPSPIPYLNGDVIQWNQDTPCSYRAELRWSALCASLKEDILELLRTRNSETYSERASVIQRNAEAQWNALPPHFKLQCNLKACAGTPFERDFLAGTRLNHLHVLFLLRLLFLDTVAEPDVAIIDISEQMLSLVVDTMLLRDQLVNSGTGLVWKVAHYGLPAAGMILLSMLKQQSSQTTGKHFMPKALLDLGIFAAQVQAGSIVRPGDPTYALIYKATQTIEKFLDSMHREAAQPPTEVTSQMEGNDDWAALFDQDVFDFETAFWQNLAGHPLFMVPEDPMSD